MKAIPNRVTELLRAWSDGNDDALEQLMPLVEDELRHLARAYMRRERREHTLQPTALVNEAFIKLTDARRVRWQDRTHFLGIAARVMRRVLVDHARHRGYQKRGGGARRVTLDEVMLTSDRALDVVALDDALDERGASGVMDAERRQRIEDLCDAALNRDVAERAPFVAAACGDDEELRSEVEALLAHADASDRFLATPIDEVAARIFAREQAPLVGHHVGAYEIVSLLGAGGMGDVYRARDTRLGREVAIKVVPDSFLSIPDRLARFELEARVLATLNHPHIGGIYGLEEADGVRGLVLELVEGPTLAERLAAGRFAIREALSIADQIADALEAAHEKGVIHRDLKPANVAITPDGTVKVLDFGLAAVATVETREGVIEGTAAYMSPEQASGKAVDRRTDIWAFGCVLYEMLTGRPAFAGETTPDTSIALLEREPDWSALPPQTPPTINRLLQRCLQHDPKRRLRDIGDARFEIDEALGHLDSKPKALAAPRPARLALWSVAIGGLLIIAGTALWQMQRSDYFWRNPIEGAKVTRLTDVAGSRHHAAISRDGKFVAFLSDRDGAWDAWVSQVGTGKVYNLTNGHLRELRNPATRTVAFSPDGSFVTLWSRVPDVGSVDAGWAVPTLGGQVVPYMKGISELDWSPDGRRLVYHPPAEGDPIFVTEPDEKVGREIFVARRGVHNHFPLWSPDGAFIYFVHGLPLDKSDVWRIRSNGGTPERLTSHDSRVTFPTLLNNDTLLYLATDEDGAGSWIYAIDVNNRIAHRISTGLEQYTSLAASADGRRLAATVSRSTEQLWRVPIGDGASNEEDAAPIPLTTAGGLSPRLGPGYVMYRASKGGTDGLWRRDAGGAATELWNGTNGRVVAGAALTRDGQRVAFTVQSGRTTHLYVMNSDGTGTRRMSDDLDVRGSPAWSPDGRWLAIAASRDGEPRLFKIPVDGGPPVPLVHDYSIDPTWSPSGTFLVYSGADIGTTFQVKAVNADGAARELPKLILTRGARRLAFLGEGVLVITKGDISHKDFWTFDLTTGREQRLTMLRRGSMVGDFDVSPDGLEIVFDRTREESDIVLFDLLVR